MSIIMGNNCNKAFSEKSRFITLLFFALTGVISIWLAFFAFDVPTMIILYQKYIYWFLTVSFFLWIISIINSFSSDNEQKIKFNFWGKLFEFCKYHSVALILSLVLMLLSIQICRPYFRVLADETNLVSISQSFYESKECYLTISSFEYPSLEKDIWQAKLEKRTAFFSYLLTIIHSLTGYRVENVFVFNFLNGFLSLFFIYYLIQLFYGRFSGILGLISLASYPLFFFYTNSSGFEVFNMLCSLVFFLTLYYYIKKPDAIRGEILLLWIPLISQSRYESVFSLFIALPLFFYLLPKKEYTNLSYKFFVFPLLFIAPAWLRMMTNNSYYWQVDDLNEGFGFNWLVLNFEKSLEFFFSGKDGYGVNVFISILSICGLVLFLGNCFLSVLKNNKTNNENSNSNNTDNTENHKTSLLRLFLFCFSVSLFYFLHAFIRYFYSWGDLTSPIMMRLGVVFLPLFVFMAIYFINKIKLQRLFLIFIFIFNFIAFFPKTLIMANIAYTNYELLVNMKFSIDFLNKNFKNNRQFIIVNTKPNLFTPFGYNAVAFTDYNKYSNKLNDYCFNKNGLFLLIFQIVDLQTNTLVDESETIDFNYLDVIKVFEIKLLNNHILKISKCLPKPVDIHTEKKE